MEDPLPAFQLGRDNCNYVRLELLTAPANKLSESYDWIEARAEVSAAGFVGRTNLYITYSDIIRFQKQLERAYDTLKGGAEFSTVEGQIGFKLTVSELGHVAVSGFLMDNMVCTAKLQFEFALDQTFLKPTLSQLKTIRRQLG